LQFALDQYKAQQEFAAKTVVSPYQTERTTRNIDSINSLYPKVAANTVGLGSYGSYIPGTAARNFDAEVQALKANDGLKDVSTSELKGMLLYAFNPQDEVAAAQVLDKFAKDEPSLKFVGAISADGKFLDANEVTTLAKMPSKNQLIAETVAMLLAPVNDVTNALSGNLHGLLDAVAAKASA
jgi:predicted lipoprotein with Yx(FWY)xxD motif